MFIDLTVYDFLVEAQVNIRMTVQISKGGGITTETRMENVQLYQPVVFRAERERYAYGTAFGYGYLTLYQVYKIVHQGRKYFHHFL
mmetsp:Transcript_94079/g.269351  ORF Transcript_94079/g.269351 Transcript_94079/m.269351 type:complete len:86 (+) Transcript_94079:404-661(+)